jgi:hypothetical protein
MLHKSKEPCKPLPKTSKTRPTHSTCSINHRNRKLSPQKITANVLILCSINHGSYNMFKVPEHQWAGLAALFSYFGAFVAFKKRDVLTAKI